MIVSDHQQTPQFSSQLPQRHHKCPIPLLNSLSVTIGPQNFLLCEKCDPIVDRVFSTVPKFVIYLSKSTPINANWVATIPNFQIITFNQLKPSLNRRLCLKMIQNLSQIGPNSSQVVVNCPVRPQNRLQLVTNCQECFRIALTKPNLVSNAVNTLPFCK